MGSLSLFQDITQARGPGSSTTAGEREAAATVSDDAVAFVKWLSVIDEDDADTAELSSLPSLQRLLERMESQKGRVLHNEAASRAEEGGYTAEDEVGRQRLLSLCREFLTRCRKLSTEEETQQLFWRVQALATNKPLEALCRKLCTMGWGTMWNRLPVWTK